MHATCPVYCRSVNWDSSACTLFAVFSVQSQLIIWPLNDNVFRHGISRFLGKALLKRDTHFFLTEKTSQIAQKTFILLVSTSLKEAGSWEYFCWFVISYPKYAFMWRVLCRPLEQKLHRLTEGARSRNNITGPPWDAMATLNGGSGRR
jgi:hypothetical protein